MAETRTAALDPSRTTDKLEDALLDVIVTRLEARGKHWCFQNALREYLDAMDIDPAHTPRGGKEGDIN